MIRRQSGQFTLTCDGCNRVIKDQGFRRNQVAWAQAQQDGWTSRPINNGKDWQHFCPAAECEGKAKAA